MTIEAAAKVIAVSTPTAKRDGQMAKINDNRQSPIANRQSL